MRRGAPARRPLAPAPGDDAKATERRLALRVWVRLLTLQKRGLAALRDELEREMTMPRFDLLANLVRQDGQTLASLSRCMLVTAGNLTGLVDRAARDGLVERRADPSDRRAWRVHVTTKGQRAFQSADRRHGQRVAKLFGHLSQAELVALLGLLDKVRGAMPDADPPMSRARSTTLPTAPRPSARLPVASRPSTRLPVASRPSTRLPAAATSRLARKPKKEP